MRGTNGADTNVFGLYELSGDGTILYSRPRAADGLHEAERTKVGQDFFGDIFPCQNVEVLRRHFRNFVTDGRSVDTFLFECLFEQEIVRAKVFMTRAREHGHDHDGEIVVMDIRQAA